MQNAYSHTQRATLILAVMIGAVVAVAIATVLAGQPYWPLGIVAAILVVTAWLFSSLTIRITPDTICWHFGPGLFHWIRPLSTIESADRSRSHWWNGWGIRFTGFGWLYNVSGFDILVITLKNGKRFGLGTDDPDGLLEAIQGALKSNS